jgi:DNA repair protein RadD
VEAVDAIWRRLLSHQTALVVASTGLGKTEVLIGLIERALAAKPDFRCVFLVNKVGLLEQSAERIGRSLGHERVGVFYGKTKRLECAVTVATIQSIHKVPLDYSLLILDECHNVNQSEGRYLSFIQRSTAENPKLKIVAVTATPFRSNGMIYGEGKLFSEITYERGLLWAQREGFLVEARLKHSTERYNTTGLRVRMGEYVAEDVERLTGDKAKLKRQLDDALPQLVGRNRVVWATSSIEHCEMVAEALRARGEPLATGSTKRSRGHECL